MSRIIVKNLPDKINKEKLLELFGQEETITDIQLKFTKTGKFRKFAFIGFKDSDHAERAKRTLNNAFINTNKIQVEICSELGDPKKPRPWSKYALENVAQKKRLENLASKEQEKKNIMAKEKIRDSSILEIFKSHVNDVHFNEFMELHGSEIKIDEDCMKKESLSEERQCENKVQVLAAQDISDLEYIKLKTGTDINLMKKIPQSVETSQKKGQNFNLFTVKLRGFPLKIKKSQIKKFLNPLKPYTIRKALKIKGIVYCGFKTEKELKICKLKNRSFFGEKRILVSEVKNKTFNESNIDEKWNREVKETENLETVAESGRIFVRNLPYSATEKDLRAIFEKFGPLTDLFLPIDSFTRKPKGFGLVTFMIPEHAWKAFNQLDGTIFQGRMLHLLPARPSNLSNDKSESLAVSFKKKKLEKEKKNYELKTNWNTYFIGENALAETLAASYNTTKEVVLDDQEGKAAVRLALGETQFVNKMKDFLKENNVLLDAFENMSTSSRSQTVILVKNLPFGTNTEEIRLKFSKFGMIKRVVLPPGGVAALVEFVEPSEAKVAFRKISYSKFKHVPLYLEWAPEKIFVHNGNSEEVKSKENEDKKNDVESQNSLSLGNQLNVINSCLSDGCVIFVKNLNFLTDENSLKEHFSVCGEVISATIARKKNGSQAGKNLSQGYGFVQFSKKEHADKALKLLQFSNLDKHKIELKRSNRTVKPEFLRQKNLKSNNLPGTKILVRNVPFQANQKEIFELFNVFGEIKAVRLPKKLAGSGLHRGFGFVEYDSVHDAKRAYGALSQSTHLYGRRLVLEWADGNDDVVSLRRKTAQQFKTGNAEKRKKIVIEEESDKEE